MKLTMVIESAPDQRFVPNLIPLLATKPLAAILEEPFVAPLLPPLLKRHEISIEILRQRSECKDGTIFFDITDQDLEGYNKFIPYYLHPRINLQRRPQQEQLPRESFGGIESVGAARAAGQSGEDLRALRRRRTRSRGRYLLQPRPTRGSDYGVA